MAVMNLFSMMTWTNGELFDGIGLPSGMDRSIMINALLDRCAEVPLRIVQPLQLQKMSEAWFEKHLIDFSKMWNAYNMEYDPLSNYSRNFEKTAKDSNEKNEKKESSNTGNSSSTNSVENKTSAFDSNDYQPYNESTGKTDGESEVNEKSENSSNEKNEHNEKMSENGRNNLSGADALKKELEIGKINVYDIIAGMYEDFFCITVY